MAIGFAAGFLDWNGGFGLAMSVASGKELTGRLPSMSERPKLSAARGEVEVVSCDILVVGGSCGGTAAAIASATEGLKVCLLEESDWLGGQLTAQGVSTPDDHRYMTTFGGTRRYYQFSRLVRSFYKANYRLSKRLSADNPFNPGKCWSSTTSFEPRVGNEILRQLTASIERSGRLKIFFRTQATGCEMNIDEPSRIRAVNARQKNGKLIRFEARFVLDATDLGDILPFCGTRSRDWTVGAEGRSDYGEPDAGEFSRPDWIQPFTYPIAVDWSPSTSTSNVIRRPDNYQILKRQQSYTIFCGAITGVFQGRLPWWSYRRVLAASNFSDARISSDLVLVNTQSNDYSAQNLIGTAQVRLEERHAILENARLASLGYLYWLQTECPREGDPKRQALGYPEIRLRTDVFDTPDGCAPMPYIRESRRIRALHTVREQDIVNRDLHGRVWQTDSRAAFTPASIGVGAFPIDIHANLQGEPEKIIETRPFQIPLGAIIPVRLSNLLPASKNLGTTHLTSGAFRVHPIEWNVGESAGLLAVYCLRKWMTPQEVYHSDVLLREFQDSLLDNGIPMYWFVDVPIEHPAFRSVQRLALAGVRLGNDRDLMFRPEERILSREWLAWSAKFRSQHTLPKTFDGTRAQAAVALDTFMRSSIWLPGALQDAYFRSSGILVRSALARAARFDAWAYGLGKKGYRGQREIDCSGLIGHAYPTLAGPRGNEMSAEEQFIVTTSRGHRSLPRRLLGPGDLIFFRPTKQAGRAAIAAGKAIHWHVGIVLSNRAGSVTYYNARAKGGVGISVLAPGSAAVGGSLHFVGGGRPPG